MNHAQILVIVYLTIHVVGALVYLGKDIRVTGWGVIIAPAFWLYVLHAGDFWS